MNAHERPNMLYTLCRRGGMVLFCLLAAAVTGLAATGWADSLFLTGGGDAAAVPDPEGEAAPDLSSRMIYVTNGSRGYDLTLKEGTAVTVRHDGSAQTLQSRQESISALLARLRVHPGPLEMVGVELSGAGVELTVSDRLIYHEYVAETVSFDTRRVPDPEMPEGEEKVIREGAGGVRTSVHEVVWSSGAELSRRSVEELSNTAVDRIVAYGTAKPAPAGASPAERGGAGSGIASVLENADGSGTLTLKDGTVLDYSGARSMTATAYTTGYDGVGTITASGTAVHVGSVAVDRSVIPLGTRLYIVADGGIAYGPAVAEDTGVKGSKVDLYYDTYEECIRFGRRPCTVYILE